MSCWAIKCSPCCLTLTLHNKLDLLNIICDGYLKTLLMLLSSWIVFFYSLCCPFFTFSYWLTWFNIHSSSSCLCLNISLSPSFSWTSASFWTSTPSTSAWLTRRASVTWRRSPLAPSDCSLLNYRPSRPGFSSFFLFLYHWPPCSFCSNKKWHTVEIQALCPCGAFSLLSSLLICT